MNCEKLIKNIDEQIKEAQLKLGFVKETMRLYYPLSSLNAILETTIDDADKMVAMLRDKVSGFSYSHNQERIEVSVPPDYVEYVHREVKASSFLVAIIELFQQNHHLQLEQVKETFAKFGTYICREMPQEADFDYVFYFEDKNIDEYYYCLKLEMGHIIYHRFTRNDFEQL